MKRSSSSIAAIASSSAVGCSAREARALGLELRPGRRTSAGGAGAAATLALLLDLRHLVGVLAEHADRLRVVEDVRRVVGRAVRVDGRARRRRPAPARSRTATTPASCGRGSRTTRPCGRRARGGRSPGSRRARPPRPSRPRASGRRAGRGRRRRAVPRDSVLPEPCDRARSSCRRHGAGIYCPIGVGCRNGETRAE